MTCRALGIHVFAGGFSQGLRHHLNVVGHLECHGFGLNTARAHGFEVHNSTPLDWPEIDSEVIFGNPRCTGFSTLTSGCKPCTHGAWSKQTQDIHDLTDYALAQKPEVIAWESVQQAYTGAGRPLINYLIHEKYAPAGYRIVHILLSAASFENAQNRRRYFFVAYKGDKAFNIEPPDIGTYRKTVYDIIWSMRHRETKEMKSAVDYDRDSYVRLTPNEWACVPHLPNGYSLNCLARHMYQLLPPEFKTQWDLRVSELPFSLHCIHRTAWRTACPTLHSNSGRMIHPSLNRPLTIGELAALMGWSTIPTGRQPIPQMAKGIVPAIGEWLGRQINLYLSDAWGGEDWESSYNDRTGVWEGQDTYGQLEKTFNLTNYVAPYPPEEHFDDDARFSQHLHRVGKRGTIYPN